MLIRQGYEISVTCNQPTPMVALLAVHDERRGSLRAQSVMTTTPETPTSTYKDLYGNLCRRFTAPAGTLTLWADCTVEDSGRPEVPAPHAREVPVADLPDECLMFLMGSRYCETDRLSQIAWNLFGHLTPGWSRVQAVCDFVHNHITFDYQAARSTRTAFDAYNERIGVCRDFAHLAVAFLRCLNIPTRYVNGYLPDIGVPLLEPMDFSAWIEVYLEGRWWFFDPRNNIPRIGRCIVARGRDAADVPLINSFGPHWLSGFRVWCYEVSEAELALQA